MQTVAVERIVNRRRWLRLDVELVASVKFAGDSTAAPLRIRNASARGLYVAMEQPRPVGSRLRVEVRLAHHPLPSILAGVVVRSVLAPVGAPVPSGVGVFLTEVDEKWTNFCAHEGGAFDG